MSLLRKASVSGLAVIIQEVASRAFSLVTTLIIARFLGATQFGEYSFALTFAAVLGTIADLGVDTIVVRELSGAEKHKSILLGNAILIKLALATTGVVLAGVIIAVSNYSPVTKTLLLIASLTLFTYAPTGGFGTIFVAVHTVNLARRFVTAVDLIARIVLISAVGLLLLGGSSLWLILLASVAIQLLGTSVVARRAVQLIRPTWSLDWGLIKTLLREALPIALHLILGAIIFRMDIFFLADWKGMAEVGMYSSAVRLAESVTILGFAISTTLLPIASQVFATNPGRFSQGIQTIFKVTALLMAPICILVSSYSDAIVSFVYSSQYLAAGKALSILIWASGLMVFNSIAATFVVAARKQLWLLGVNLCTFALTLVLNWVLIPPLSFVGASIATLGTQMLGAVLYISILLRNFHQVLPSSLKQIGLVGIVFMVVVLFSKTLPVLVGVALAILAYLPLILVFRVVSWNDVKVLWTTAQASEPSEQ